jgi:bacillithiol biosynthesis deacetylase BshB1
MSAPVDVLAFSPHPDDAEIGCGGLLLLSARQGLTTAIVDLTEGEKATRGTPAIRLAEKALAAQRLGVTQRIGLGLPDTRLGTAADHEAAIVDCLRALRPRLVLAPGRGDRHPDHVEAARLIERAAFFAGVQKVGSGAPHRIERLLHYTIHQPVTPTLVVDVTAVWPDYRDVLAAYRSQFVSGSTGEAATALSDGGFLDVLEARGRHYGAMINVGYGEPYVSTAPLFVDSPANLLRPAGAPAAYGSFR